VPQQGTRRFRVIVERAPDPRARYPELKGILTLGPYERSQRAQEYLRDGDRAYSLREDRLESRSAALHDYTLAVLVLESLGQQSTLLDDARAKKTTVGRELDELWGAHFSRLTEAFGVGDGIRAREEAYFLSQVFPEGSGKRFDLARTYLDQLTPR
jgi:hypothetical protein